MNFALTDDQLAIRSAVEEICTPFNDDYWHRKDRDGGFPRTSTPPWPKRAGWAWPCLPNTAARAWASPRRH